MDETEKREIHGNGASTHHTCVQKELAPKEEETQNLSNKYNYICLERRRKFDQ